MQHVEHPAGSILGTPPRVLSISFYHWKQSPPALQNFLEDMLDMLHNLGLKVPSQSLPPIIWHNRAYFPGETLVNAMHAGASFFRAKPDIIFVCLPEKGRAAPPVSESRTALI